MLFWHYPRRLLWCAFQSVPIYAQFSLIVPLVSKSQSWLSNHGTVLKLFVLPILLFSLRSSHFFHCCPLSLHCFLQFLFFQNPICCFCAWHRRHTYTDKVLITRNGLTESLLVYSQVMIFNHSYSNTHGRDNKLCWWLYVDQDFAGTRHTHLVQDNRPTVRTNGQNGAVISGTSIITVDGQMLWLKMMIDSGPVQLPYCYIKDLIEECCVLILSSEAQWMHLHSFALVFAVAEWLKNTFSLPAPQITKLGRVP